MKNDANNASHVIKVWDIGTRLFHWILVVLFSLSAYSAFQDKFGLYADIHLWSGFSVLALVSWRILWGFVGSDTSRFRHFVKGPRATVAYAKGAFKKAPYRWVGHNPLGGWSVLLMLLLLLAQAGLGLFATDDMIFSGPFSDEISDSLAGNLTELHEKVGYTLFGLVGLHLLVIVLIAVRRGTNLVVPMITGNKKQPTENAVEKPDLPTFRSSWLALATVIVVGVVLYWYIFL